MVCLKSGLHIFLKRSIQTPVVNSHTVTCKPIAAADNPALLELSCNGHSDFYKDLNSVRIPLSIKIFKTDGSDIESAEPNTVGCIINLLHSMFSYISFLQNGKPVTLHETNYHYKAYLEKLRILGSETTAIHLVSSFWYIDSSGEFEGKNGYVRRLNYFISGNIIEIYARFHSDMFNSDKMLVNGVEMNIKLTLAQESFIF